MRDSDNITEFEVRHGSWLRVLPEFNNGVIGGDRSFRDSTQPGSRNISLSTNLGCSKCPRRQAGVSSSIRGWCSCPCTPDVGGRRKTEAHDNIDSVKQDVREDQMRLSLIFELCGECGYGK